MDRRAARFTVLCEDRQHWAFINRYLKGSGFEQKRIHLVPFPAGKAAGDQHVLEQFVRELREHRSRSHHQDSPWLIVMIDADRLTMQERLKQLRKRLTDAGEQPLDPEERVLLLVPKRNIETWIHNLLGEATDEEQEYPKLKGRESECQPAVKKLIELLHKGEPWPEDWRPSLVEALSELKRLP